LSIGSDFPFAGKRRLYHVFYLVSRHVPGLFDGPFVTTLGDGARFVRLGICEFHFLTQLPHIREGIARAAPTAMLHVINPAHKKAAAVAANLRPTAPIERHSRNTASH